MGSKISDAKVMIDTTGAFVEVTGLGTLVIPEIEYSVNEYEAFDKDTTQRELGKADVTEGRMEGVYDATDTSSDPITPGAVFAHDKIKFYPDRNSNVFFRPSDGASVKIKSAKRNEIVKGQNRKLLITFIITDGSIVEDADV